jgi:nicotinate dehydrogenase subunit A
LDKTSAAGLGNSDGTAVPAWFIKTYCKNSFKAPYYFLTFFTLIMSNSIQFQLNGQVCSVSTNENTPLLYVLRNDLDHKGSRFGCGSGNCGACTVIVDGVATQSCNTPLWSVSQRNIVTAEGLQLDTIGKLVQEAFIAEQAAQCGYCINGIMMTVTALLKKNPQPSRAEQNAALDVHLCRCGTHVRIFKAVERVINALAKEVA